jgi:triosephosphate isomerase
MREIYVNLKRFEVPKSKGGLCPTDDPIGWIESVIGESVDQGLGSMSGVDLVYLLSEGLVHAASETLHSYPEDQRSHLAVGCQGVHWEDVEPGGNFGAFTASLPATSAVALGSTWAIIGHSEERRAKRQVMEAYDPSIGSDEEAYLDASNAVDQLIQQEVQAALGAGLNALVCVGESAEERGEGTFEEQKPRIKKVLEAQLRTDFQGAESYLQERRIAIGYEPIWAIGPGRTPPGEAYISFVSAHIKEVVEEMLELDVSVVYGGGLKEENAAMIASIETIDGGLVALTRFTGDIGFDVAGLQGIVEKYVEA